MPRKIAKRTDKLKIKVALEKFTGRLKCLRRKAHELSQQCQSEIYVVLRREGKYYTYMSTPGPTWPPSKQEMDELGPQGDHQRPEFYEKRTGVAHPQHEVPQFYEEHSRLAHPQHQELDLVKLIPPVFNAVEPTYVPYASTTPQLVYDSFSLYQPARAQYLDQHAWTRPDLFPRAEEYKGHLDHTLSKAQIRIRSSEETGKSLYDQTASTDQEHVEEGGVDYSKSRKRKFQTSEKSDEDSGLNKRRKLSHQSIHQDSKSFLESANFSPEAVESDVIQHSLPDLADTQLWLTEMGNIDIVNDEGHDPAVTRTWLKDGQNVEFIKDVSPYSADTRA